MPDGEAEQSGLSEAQEERWRELHEQPLDELSDAEVTSKIKLSVRRRFDYPEWVLMFEYGAPGNDGRVCDCLAVNTIASRNYKVVGFEFKASRSDWLREKRDASKADYFVRLADEFYVVAPKGVVEQSEIPDGWGYLELKPNSEQLYKLEDSELTEHQQGEPGRRFWVRFLKQAVGSQSNYTKDDLEEARSRGYQEAIDEGISERKIDRNLDRLRDKAERWEQLQESELGWLPGYRFGEEEARTLELAWKLVRLVAADDYNSLRGEVDHLRDSVERKTERMLSEVDEIAAGLDALQERVEDGDVPPGPGGTAAAEQQEGGD